MRVSVQESKWINISAIAALVFAVLYVFLWPGPEGLPVVKIGIPQRTIQLETTIFGLSDTSQDAFQVGQAMKVSIDKATPAPVTLAAVEPLPDSVWATLPDGSIKAQPDPRPELSSVRNLRLTFEGAGYANRRGAFLDVKRVRIGSAVEVIGDNIHVFSSIIDVDVQPS